MYIHFKCTSLPCRRVCLMQGCVRSERNSSRAAGQCQGLAGQLLMKPLANYCSLSLLLPVTPFCIPVEESQSRTLLLQQLLEAPQYELGANSSGANPSCGYTPGTAQGFAGFLPRSQPGEPTALAQLQRILVQNPAGCCAPEQAGLPLPPLFPGWAGCRELPERKAGLCPAQQLGRNGKRLGKGRERCGASWRD